MEVIIVAKTHMRNAACVGGFEIATKKSVRLLTSNGENQPSNTELEVGQIWNIEYSVRAQLIAPHVEDVQINGKNFIRTQNSVGEFLKNNATIWRGDPRAIFEGKVHFGRAQSGYITNNGGIPSQSVGFWLADKDLELTILDDQKHYYYFGDGGEIFAFPYVGYSPVVETIKKGTLIRVSLARWWKPNERVEEKRCYCQLSGWY